MILACRLCGDSDFGDFFSFFDSQHQSIDCAICNRCEAINPVYEEDCGPDVLAQQIRRHEMQWEDSKSEDLDNTVTELGGLVDQLKPYLGMPSKNNIVIEIGAGRGSLLRALIDKGYSAYGCEVAPKLVDIAREYYRVGCNSLFKMEAQEFLQSVVPTLLAQPKVFILWHVIEHLKDPLQLLRKIYAVIDDDGFLIVQLPVLTQKQVYPEHYFFVTHKSIEYIAKDTGFRIQKIEYDLENFFVTVIFCKRDSGVQQFFSPFSNGSPTPTALIQCVLLRDVAIESSRTTIDAQTRLIDDKVSAMGIMERMIRERDESLQAKTVEFDYLMNNRLIRALKLFRIL